MIYEFNNGKLLDLSKVAFVSPVNDYAFTVRLVDSKSKNEIDFSTEWSDQKFDKVFPSECFQLNELLMHVEETQKDLVKAWKEYKAKL